MRFMLIVLASPDSEAGIMPTTDELNAMGKFNEEMVKAGIMLAGEGLHPSSRGARVKFSGNQRSVVDGPFPNTTDLVAGFWLIQVKSLEEAIEWVKRAPNPMPGGGTIEIRQVFELEEFGDTVTDEVRERETRLRTAVEGQSAAAP